MKKIHLIYVPFTGLGIQEFKGNSWYEYRANLFEKYVLQSLKNQTEKDFVLWISFRAEEKENPTTHRIQRAIENAGIEYVLTFNGIMMWDDRGTWHNDTLKERMEKSLKEVQEKTGQADWVYKTDLGSDDMFSAEAVAEIQAQEPKERKALYYLNGYVFDMENQRVAEWNRETSCSKYTIIYPYETFFNAEKHLKYIEGLESHEFIPKVFNAIQLSDRRYMCGVHGGNISTSWNNPERGRQFNDIEKLEILKQFGIHE